MRNSGEIERDIREIPQAIKEAARRGDYTGVQKITVRRQELENELLKARGQEAETGIDRTGAEIRRLMVDSEKSGDQTAILEQAVKDAKAAFDAHLAEGVDRGRALARAMDECRRSIQMAVCARKASEEFVEVVSAETMREDPEPDLKARVSAVMAGSIHPDYLANFGPVGVFQFNEEMRVFQEGSKPAREILREILQGEADRTGGV